MSISMAGLRSRSRRVPRCMHTDACKHKRHCIQSGALLLFNASVILLSRAQADRQRLWQV